MPRLTGPVRSALADWWSLAYDAGFGGYSATDTITAASDLARQTGRSFAFATGNAIATLFGYARRMSNASDVLTSAADNHYIESKHIAIPPWARDEQAMNTNPIWHVTYHFTTIDATGAQSTAFKTSIFEYPQPFPDTVGALKEAVTEDAQALASKYGLTFVGIDLHQILAV
jgi:hypothetical protein